MPPEDDEESLDLVSLTTCPFYSGEGPGDGVIYIGSDDAICALPGCCVGQYCGLRALCMSWEKITGNKKLVVSPLFA